MLQIPDNSPYTPGTVEASEQLLRDLYLELRQRLLFWATLTQQTSQPRMGYVGQHLVSVVTGFPGGRSGARGYDLVHPDGSPGEIKTCYRVDQLGECTACRAGVAPYENVCPECGYNQIERKDDSKWLISCRHDGEFAALLEPKFYYFVLFEFVDLHNPDTTQISIWSVDPRNPGFVLSMVDYYLNIRANSTSKAPSTLWPYSLKFELMRGDLIYRALIYSDDSIETKLFPGRDTPVSATLSDLVTHSGTRMSVDKWAGVWENLRRRGAQLPDVPWDKHLLLQQLEQARSRLPVTEAQLIDLIALWCYRDLVELHTDTLPPEVGSRVAELLSFASGPAACLQAGLFNRWPVARLQELSGGAGESKKGSGEKKLTLTLPGME